MSALITALAEGESAETLAALRGCLTEVQAELRSIKKDFGAPGDHGYGTPAGDVLFRVYRLAAAVSDALDRLPPASPDEVA